MTRDGASVPDVPEGWKWMELGDVVQKASLTGRKLKKRDYQETGKLPVVDQGRSAVGGYTDREDLVVPCELPVIVFGDHTKAVKYVDSEFVAGADGVEVLQPEKVFLPKLFYYFVQAIQLPDKGYARHFQFLHRSLIPLPPLPEQHRIASKIEELFTQLDAGVAAAQKAKAQLQRYRQAVLKAAMEGDLTKEWREAHKGELQPASVLLERILEERRAKWQAEQLAKMRAKGKVPKDDGWKRKYKEPAVPDTTDLPGLPEGWVWTNVGQIGFVKGGKRLPKGHTYAESPTDYPYIRVIDFVNMSVNAGELKHLKPETQSLIGRYTISKDDVYISIAGSIGKIGVIPEYLDGANLTENAAKVSGISGFDNRLVSHFLNGPDAQGQIARLIISSNQPKLALFRIEKVVIPLPPLVEQGRIVEETESRLSVADEMERAVDQGLRRAERLRQSILKKAFEGRLVPQDPTDEPAFVLLERINAEKARRESEKKTRKKRRRTDTPQQMELI